MAARAFICGLSGHDLTDDERYFLREAQPWGVILFRRNVDSPIQVAHLCREIRNTLERDVPILVDQEGGRVQRIGPPHLRRYPAGAEIGALYRQNPVLGVEAALIGAKLIALDLVQLGITVDCLPVLDIPVPGSDSVVGDRALGEDPDAVTAVGGAQIAGLLAGGVLPVIKHVPGHGRATADSHKELPRVDATLRDLDSRDFVPFRLLAGAAPLAMTAHVVYSAVDDTNPATLSSEVIGKVIRKRIGFDGALMSDDISMGALSGTIGSRAHAAIVAGCDLVLHCNGDLGEMREVAGAAPALSGAALDRTQRALGLRSAPGEQDRAALEARFDRLLGQTGTA